MKLLKKLLGKKKKAEKKARKTKRILRVLALCTAFCAGAVCTGWFVYAHRNVIAAAVSGKKPPKCPHGLLCAKKLRKKS